MVKMVNKIICGDCKNVLENIPANSVDLIYLDPPFSSNQEYTGFWNKTQEELTFDDSHWEAGVKGYTLWLIPRIEQCYRILKPTGSLYLHCDWHANAHIRIMLDKIFGVRRFKNEIVWEYAQSIKRSSKKFLSNHDIIFFYTKGEDYLFNSLENPYTKKQIERFKHEDKEGKFYYDTRRDSHGTKKQVKVYLHKKGTPIGSVWYYPHVQGNERIGYPTQKPEALLERIIKASSNEGDVVLDPFCGCGTTIAVAAKLNRQFIGIDIYRMAIKVMENRLNNLKRDSKIVVDFDTIIPFTIENIKSYDWRNFQDWACEKLGAYKGKTGADEGIDGITYHKDTVVFDTVRKQKVIVPEGSLIQTKHFERGTIGEPHLKKFESTIRQHRKNVGIIIGWEFSKDALIYSIDAEERGILMYLVRAKDLYGLETLKGPY